MNNIDDILKKYNEEYHVASLRDETMSFLFLIIEKNNIANILEIGGGVGYGAYRIVNRFPCVKIDSIEKNEDKTKIAKEILSDYKNITFINEDCYLFNTTKKYNLIIIDGPKRNQIKLFNHLLKFANNDTIFFVDNIKLLSLRNLKNRTTNQQKIIDSVDEFKQYLLTMKDLKFKYFDIDDGIMVGGIKWN